MFELNFSKQPFISLVIVLLLGLNQSLYSQNFAEHEYDSDSLSSSMLHNYSDLNVADILLDISHTNFKTEVNLFNLMNGKNLYDIETANDSIIRLINSKFLKYKHDIETRNDRSNRFLANDAVYWGHYLETIDLKINEITNEISYYNSIHKKFINKNKDFEVIDEYIDGHIDAGKLGIKVDETKTRIDQVITVLNNKKIQSVEILENLIAVKLELVTLIQRVKNVLRNRRTSLTSIRIEPLYSIDYFDNENWDLSEMPDVVDSEIKGLMTYVDRNKKLFTYNLIFTLLLISALIYLKHTHTTNITYEVTKIKLLFFKLLSKPISTGFIVGGFLFMGFYTSPPLIYYDFIRTIFIIPYFVLLSVVIDKKHHVYIYTLIGAIAVRFIYILLPEGTIYTRVLLILLAVFEIWGAIIIGFYFKANVFFKSKYFNYFLLSIVVITISVAFFGFISNIMGKVMLAELFLDSIIRIFVSVLTTTFLLIVINGLLILFIESEKADKIRSIRKNRRKLILGSNFITKILIGVLLVYYILNDIGFADVVYNTLLMWFTYPITIASVTFSASNIFTFILIIWVSIILSRLINAILAEDVLVKIDVEPGLANTIRVIIKYSIITFGFFAAANYTGVPFSQLALMFSAFGIGIGFGLQNIFNNIVSGFILLFERPIKIEDIVEVGPLIGEVKSIGIRASKIRTFDGAEIIVPNGNLISNEVINWTLSERTRRFEFIVGISYDSDPDTAKEVLMSVLEKNKSITTHPKPEVMFTNLGDSSLDFRMLYWTSGDWVLVRSEVIFGVYYALKEAGIEIPFPQQDLHLRSIDDNVEIKQKPIINRKL